MNRNHLISRLSAEPEWDVAIVGGGATGLA